MTHSIVYRIHVDNKLHGKIYIASTDGTNDYKEAKVAVTVTSKFLFIRFI